MAQQPFEESTESAAYHADEVRTPEERRRVALTWLVAIFAIAVFSFRRPDLAFAMFMFALTLSVLVFVHEWGHYQFALWAGMRVKRFAIGFPPFIYTKRRNNIDYSIGALPIGGMVDIAGLGSEEEMVGTAKGTTSAHAAPDKHKPFGTRNFQDASLGWRFMTLFAGPMMNFIFTIVVSGALLSIVGYPIKGKPTTIVDTIQTGTPAFYAGLQSDDKLLSINKVRSEESKKLIDEIIRSKGKPVTVTYQRAGVVKQTSMKPLVEDVTDDGINNPRPFIGIGFAITGIEYKRLGLLMGETGFKDSAIGVGILSSFEATKRFLGLVGRAATARLSDQDKRGVGGPVKIAQTVNDSARRSMYEWVQTAAAISLSLGLMNLLPIPALDGGRIMFILYEAITRRPFDARKEGFVNAIGMAMVLTFMLFMTFRDVLPFIQKSLMKS